MCSVIEAGCEVRYHVGRLVTGDEDQIVVYFDRNQSNARTLRDNPGNNRPISSSAPIPYLSPTVFIPSLTLDLQMSADLSS